MYQISFHSLNKLLRFLEYKTYKDPAIERIVGYQGVIANLRNKTVESKLIFSITQEWPSVSVSPGDIRWIAKNALPTSIDINEFLKSVGI